VTVAPAPGAQRQLAITREDSDALTDRLDAYVPAARARAALLVDRAGQLLACTGTIENVDIITFATLASADFNANEQLARLVGETEFRTLLHRGEVLSVDLADVAGRAVLITVFDSTSTPGLVRHTAEPAAREIAVVLGEMIERKPQPDGAHRLLAGAEEEIDRMFDW
jgi:predicted regulator of Ras-like GTPase activity (Roadblock/LC7/MglB family)